MTYNFLKEKKLLINFFIRNKIRYRNCKLLCPATMFVFSFQIRKELFRVECQSVRIFRYYIDKQIRSSEWRLIKTGNVQSIINYIKNDLIRK